MLKEIQSAVESAVASDSLEHYTFVIMDVRTWCNVQEKKLTLPAEIGMARVSLAGGVIDEYNVLIHHGEIPRG